MNFAAQKFSRKISSETVKADFNDLPAVLHYTRAAHELGLWQSERRLIEKYFPDHSRPIIEAGCGAGRVTLGLWEMGFRRITAFDFAEELLDQARSLAAERAAEEIDFRLLDARKLGEDEANFPVRFQGALFMFNGLMQIPGRENRRLALRGLHRVCESGAPLLFTTHDREISAVERELWQVEAERWAAGRQDSRLVEFGDRYFEDETGRTFMHLPDRKEILQDLAATGWRHSFDEIRTQVASESRSVLDFSDECRFWVACRE